MEIISRWRRLESSLFLELQFTIQHHILGHTFFSGLIKISFVAFASGGQTLLVQKFLQMAKAWGQGPNQ